MNDLRNRIAALCALCDEDERDLIETMIRSAADYVRAVVVMEAAASNYAGREAEQLRTTVAELDRSRRTVHNGLISSVDIVNRICAAHDAPLIYTGDEKRRHYGDFALSLVQEIFEARG